MGKGSSAPEYSSATASSGGLFGSSTTDKNGSTWTPTDFQKELVGVTEANATKALNEYLNPNYDSEAFHQADSYYTNKMNNTLQNDYLNGALSNGLLKGSTASDVMRGFASDLANTEYERQQDYKNQQLQNYQAAMLPYATVYDMYTGQTQLSNNLANALSQYNLNAYKATKAANNTSGIGSLLGGISSLANTGLNAYSKFGGTNTGSSMANSLSADDYMTDLIWDYGASL